MPLRIEILPKAERELAEASAYYEKISIRLKDRFLDAFVQARARMEISSELPAVIDGDARARKLERFPYNVIYVRRGDTLYIVAIMHQRRRPNYWKDRIAELP